ncbi:MAG: helix-hairpin-helix domain-containing protein [Saprospiraceae bacterium]|jgi:competence protein ComEA|nr:helix-hairpin-helix domain-containing protein [Saprospiraceae bacterium]
MLKHLIRQFHFSKTERYGAAALLLLIGSSYIAPEVYLVFHKPESTDFSEFESRIAKYRQADFVANEHSNASEGTTLFFFDPNTAPAETLCRLGVTERVAHTIVRYRERGGKFRSADDLGKIYTLPKEVFERLRPYVRIGGSGVPARNRPVADAVPSEQFPFDPNTASERDLLRLGLPKALVVRLLRYREKGGVFVEKTDFRKLYGLTDADFQRLEPYISIIRAEAVVRPATYADGYGKKAAPTSLDINTATPDDWQQLPGIGAGRANQIVRFREKLGGFVRVDQVGETFGMPDSVFQNIRAYLQLNELSIQKINLNTATEEILDAHPYISFKQAKMIVAYREQHGQYTRAEDIRRIAAFSDSEWLARVLPYLMAQ